MAVILDGKTLAKNIKIDLAKRVEKLKKKTSYVPTLATIIVGDDLASVTYVNMKAKACMEIGLNSKIVKLPSDTTTKKLLSEIDKLNKDASVCGILLQHPVPRHIDELSCFNNIAISKDVDGVNSTSFGLMSMKQLSFVSATPLGVMTLLKYYNIDLVGKSAIVIGRSPILGKPIAMQLLNADATVTIAHTKTTNLPSLVHQADIVVACIGKPKFVQADWIKEGAVLVDCGYNEGNIGDIDIENAKDKAIAYTPVPGGVGPMTIASLLSQAVDAAEKMQ